MAARSANAISGGNNGGRVSVIKGVVDLLSLGSSDHSCKADLRGGSRGHRPGVRSYLVLSHGYLGDKSGAYLRTDIPFVPKYSMSCHGAQGLDLIFVGPQ